MKPAIISDSAKSAKSVAAGIARQIAQEPAEILKDAGEQVRGDTHSETAGENFKGSDENLAVHQANDQATSQRLVKALQKEIEDIQKHDLVSTLQAKISEGTEVALNDYHELSMEEKQVLKAQMEAVRKQNRLQAYNQSLGEVPAIHSKPSRRFGAGQKQEAEREQTRVEKPIPPSG